MVVRQLCGCGEACGVVVACHRGFCCCVWETANPKNVSPTTTTQIIRLDKIVGSTTQLTLNKIR